MTEETDETTRGPGITDDIVEAAARELSCTPWGIAPEDLKRVIRRQAERVLNAALRGYTPVRNAEDKVSSKEGCLCVYSCADDPPTACHLSGQWHTHPDEEGGFGPCPVHPDAPGDY